MCLVQVHNAVPPVRLEHATPQSRVKHSTLEALAPYVSSDGSLYISSGHKFEFLN